MYAVGQLLQHPTQEFCGHRALSTGMKFDEGHFTGAVDDNKEILPAFFDLVLGEIDVQVAVVLKFLFRRILLILVGGRRPIPRRPASVCRRS